MQQPQRQFTIALAFLGLFLYLSKMTMTMEAVYYCRGTLNYCFIERNKQEGYSFEFILIMHFYVV